ncbi:MAG TPA: LemA family protein [Candidatus Coprenecus avistercoris]|uniref:LemA family protein n=1 Tax=Candidatus Coprenecus avistercoris TaxID=2840730 RepID=A0A9D1E1Y8_9BACT|nr:LemA family protein [Candidatus Coprenecus avistercoris]
MKRGYVTLIVIVAVVLVLFFWIKGMYNSMVRTDETVSQAWAQVENVYQRRADLVPNLVATVKGYAEHESSTLEAVVKARAKATQATVDPSTLSEEELARFMSAQNELGTAIGRLLVSVERYPDLKANQNFLELQAQLEGTENRITVERQKFNEAARNYNVTIRRFPNNIFAGMFGFEKKGYFEASEGAEQAPVVSFE